MLLALALLIVTRLLTIPASPWEFDEPLFYQALHHYDPLSHHPPPPGYPLFILAGKAMRAIVPDDFHALVIISFVAAIVGFVFLALAFRNMTGSLRTGLAGALLFYLSPVMLVQSMLPFSDPGALALLAATMYFATVAITSPSHMATMLGLTAALTVGWRPQFAIVVVPLLAATVIMMREWRGRVRTVVVFALACAAWLIPLAIAVGGLRELIAFEAGQAGYLAQHDADVSRSHWSAPGIALRFIAHPWGTKQSSFPILLLAAIGAGAAVRARRRETIPLAIGCGIYLAVALRIMDPADGVRYALPSVVAVAFFAALGAASIAPRLTRGLIPWTVVAFVAVGSYLYLRPFLRQRVTSDSPPVQAARYAVQAFPPDAVALFELPLWPHASYFFAGRETLRIDDGLKRYADRPDVPLFLYADGGSRIPGTRTFQWTPSDAYSKLTRNFYRVSSIIPIPPERRFVPLSGIYSLERERDGLDEWRWLDERAELRLPRQHGPTLQLVVGLPESYPFESNVLTVTTDAGTQRVPLGRGVRVPVTIAVPAGPATVRFVAERSFIPAAVTPENRDPRRLAVKLYDVCTREC